MIVVRRQCERKKLELIKTEANRGTKLEAVKHIAWLYIGRLLQEMAPQEVIAHMTEHITILIKNLYEGQEARVRTHYWETEWFKVNKGVRTITILV